MNTPLMLDEHAVSPRMANTLRQRFFGAEPKLELNVRPYCPACLGRVGFLNQTCRWCFPKGFAATNRLDYLLKGQR